MNEKEPVRNSRANAPTVSIDLSKSMSTITKELRKRFPTAKGLWWEQDDITSGWVYDSSSKVLGKLLHVDATLSIGTRVNFKIDNLGSSERDALYAVTDETYGKGDEGVVSFKHPNQKMCADWVYVEVDSKTKPGVKLYVGVTPRMVDIV